ncbi:MAG: hypothetical protein KDI44_01055 [Thiothrix sp.]|nr:hypothetical protein [Thiothrix sp.]HPQ96519.1 prefoldin domain-containing protein [Thiolinea sp.]
MDLPVPPVTFSTLASLLFGLLAGMVLAHYQRRTQASHLRLANAELRHQYHLLLDETAGLKDEIKVLSRQNAEPRPLQPAEAIRLESALGPEPAHDTYLRIRKQLERARKTIERLKGELDLRMHQLQALEQARQQLKQRLERMQALPAPSRITRLPTPSSRRPGQISGHDDLQKIEGISPDTARKLQNLGFVSYRQLAECGNGEFRQIQKLLRLPDPRIMLAWKKGAYLLHQAKYVSPTPVQHPEQRRTGTG